jgi:para-nitrobenzyl esterase
MSGENQYLGIPYAAPPVGRLRWLPPQPPADFSEVFQATKFGEVCTQNQAFFVGTPIGSEDCLYLNVYVPDVVPPPHGFPVMVWIHGGALVSGAGSLCDPTPLVEKGNVIVVTINYRLGLLGFFAHPALDREGHLNANYGLMDQQFALDWVRRNIGGFGGDHKRVTIFGESAGGFSVLSNLASPTAAGLFQRAISESGAYAEFQDYWDSISLVPLAAAETMGTALVPAGMSLATDVGCSSQTAQCLRAIPASTLVEAQPRTLFPALGLVFPIIDGTVLTQTLDAAFKSGAFNRVPVISGTNHDEWRLFVAFQYDLEGNPLTDAEYQAAVAGFLQPVPDLPLQFVLGVYPLSNYPPPPGYFVRAPQALGALGTDSLFVCTSRNAEYVPTYSYEFNDETAPSVLPPLSFPLGDAHIIELEYLFNLSAFGISPTFTPDQQQLSDTMIGYWTQFAKTGNPNSEGAPNWPSYNATAQLQSLLAPTAAPESDSSFDADHKCSSFWDTF